MKPGLSLLALVTSIALLALALACGGAQTSGTPPALRSPIPPSPLVVPTASLGSRVTFYGANAGDSASAIAAGDFNGDIVQDIVLTAGNADGRADARPDAGEAYIFLVPFTAGEARDPAAGEHDLVIYGAHAGGQLGRALATGDFNGDGVDDIALGAPFADGPDLSRPDSGEVYVLFGSSRLGNEIREVDPAEGGHDVTILGPDAEDLTGFALHTADVNGDGLSDAIISASNAGTSVGSKARAGAMYVFYDRLDEPYPGTAAREDITLQGLDAEDILGHEAFGKPPLTTADMDADGRGDVLATAPTADGPGNQRLDAGEAYIIYMKEA